MAKLKRDGHVEGD